LRSDAGAFGLPLNDDAPTMLETYRVRLFATSGAKQEVEAHAAVEREGGEEPFPRQRPLLGERSLKRFVTPAF